jgi:hypothetical protein
MVGVVPTLWISSPAPYRSSRAEGRKASSSSWARCAYQSVLKTNTLDAVITTDFDLPSCAIRGRARY